MAGFGPLTSFGGKRYCGDRKFAGLNVFMEDGVEVENVVASGPLTSFGGKRYWGERFSDRSCDAGGEKMFIGPGLKRRKRVAFFRRNSASKVGVFGDSGAIERKVCGGGKRAGTRAGLGASSNKNFCN